MGITMLLGKSLIALIVIYLYYKLAKQFIFYKAPHIARYFGLTKRYSIMTAAGVVQLILIALSHVLFCVLLVFLFQIKHLGLITVSPSLLVLGFLVGVGCMGLSTLLCQAGMIVGEKIFPQHVPANAKSWLTIARGGWMRHHLHNMEILPLALAFLIVILQIGSEEVVFRGVMLNFFISNGTVTAILISTALFMYMQIFHMSSPASAMFPVLGALVLGIINGVLYVHIPMLLPLIVAHLAFFVFAVL